MNKEQLIDEFWSYEEEPKLTFRENLKARGIKPWHFESLVFYLIESQEHRSPVQEVWCTFIGMVFGYICFCIVMFTMLCVLTVVCGLFSGLFVS